jgi:DNA polymerase-3 subunit epsilon
MPQPIAVIDFETTGMGPAQGARATEVAIVLIEGGQVVDRFQSLMRTGAWIPPFITRLTGITNAMVAAAPPAEEVMRDAARFVGSAPMVAHNAAFDSKFWQSELALAGEAAPQPFACPWPSVPTGRWPMPRWPPPCWRACSRTCAGAMHWPGPSMRC